MDKLVEAYGAVYDMPLKGHDRLFLDDDAAFFAVFDGAGGDELSEAMICRLPELISAHAPLRQESQEAFIAQVCSGLDNLREAFQRKATGALACMIERQDMIDVTYANAGDSSIYFWDKAADTFTRIAHTPTEYVEVGKTTFIVTTEFFGAGRSPEQIAPHVGRILVPKSAEWSLIGLTDGVQDDEGQGITTASLEEIVRSTDAPEVPNKILDSLTAYDDASVFIIQH